MTTDTLYEQDFATWTERQARALRDAARRGSNLPIDWEHVAEEIEDLGKEVRNRVRSLAFQIQVHLLKIACSPSVELRPKWMGEVDEWRMQLNDELDENAAIRARFAALAAERFERAVKHVGKVAKRYGEEGVSARLAAWRLRGISAEEILTDGLFPEPGGLTFRQE